MSADVNAENVDIETVELIEAIELRIADRCDVGGCNAQAFVVTGHDAGILLWCSHHFDKLSRSSGDLIDRVMVDSRTQLTNRETGDHA